MEFQTLSRRDLLRFAGMAGVAGMASSILPHHALAATSSPISWGKTLVMIKFNGGNDGLNTLIPYTDELYKKSRPTLAVVKDKQMPLTSTLALHTALAPLANGPGTAWGDKDMVIALGVGYPDTPDMDSHFHGSDMVTTAQLVRNTPYNGWISQFMEEVGTSNRPVNAAAEAAVLGSFNPPGPVAGQSIRTVFNPGTADILADFDSNITQRMKDNPIYAWNVNQLAIAKYSSDNVAGMKTVVLKNTFPTSDIGKQLEETARMIISKTNIPVISVTINGFDTHQSQNVTHPGLLSNFADSVAIFRKEMIEQGLWNNVLVVTFAEFGRSLYENSVAGTDHGRASAHFILGGQVNGGNFIGNQVSLSQVDAITTNVVRGLPYQLDFRHIYATIMQQWWKGPRAASDAVLSGAFNPVPFLKS